MSNIWTCKIGECELPADSPPADPPMRDAVERAYRELTGRESEFIFSGWGGNLEEIERAVVDDRPPDVALSASRSPRDLEAAREAVTEHLERLFQAHNLLKHWEEGYRYGFALTVAENALEAALPHLVSGPVLPEGEKEDG